MTHMLIWCSWFPFIIDVETVVLLNIFVVIWITQVSDFSSGDIALFLKRLLSKWLVTFFYLLSKASFPCIWHLTVLILFPANIVSSLFIGSGTSAAIVSHELNAALCFFKIISRKPHSVTVLHNHTTHTHHGTICCSPFYLERCWVYECCYSASRRAW